MAFGLVFGQLDNVISAVPGVRRIPLFSEGVVGMKDHFVPLSMLQPGAAIVDRVLDQVSCSLLLRMDYVP